MKKKNKKKNKNKVRKLRKKIKKKLKIRRIRKKIKKKGHKYKKTKKKKILKSKKKYRLSNLKISKFQISRFKEQRKKLKKITFQNVLSFILHPFFKAYEDFTENRKKAKLIKIALEKKERERQIEEERRLRYESKQQELRDEIKFAKEREQDLKKFIRQEQAILRKEQAERQRKFLQELKLEQQIQKFRIREVKELEKLEKISLSEQREDYSGLQDRIEKLKEKYRLIRDQKIRDRVEALGIKTSTKDDRETLLQREKEYTIARHKIEMALESFYRSASSLVFQLNKRHITRDMSIFRCIDRRFETGEIFIKWDESDDQNWLILIYIKDNSPDKGIVIEDKSNPEKNQSHEFKPSDIFKASDLMVDSLTQLLAKERSKKVS